MGAYALRSMFHVMSDPSLSTPTDNPPSAATRHLPIARAIDRSTIPAPRVNRTPSEPRLQSAVVRKDATSDPYADPPCTD